MNMTLTGLFFVHDIGEFYRTGVVFRQAHPDAYLVRYDNMKRGSDMPDGGMALLTVSCDLSATDDEDNPIFRFFETRDELDTWVSWLETPVADAEVLSLVKKGKTH